MDARTLLRRRFAVQRNVMTVLSGLVASQEDSFVDEIMGRKLSALIVTPQQGLTMANELLTYSALSNSYRTTIYCCKLTGSIPNLDALGELEQIDVVVFLLSNKVLAGHVHDSQDDSLEDFDR
jgi:hypothetical protein